MISTFKKSKTNKKNIPLFWISLESYLALLAQFINTKLICFQIEAAYSINEHFISMLFKLIIIIILEAKYFYFIFFFQSSIA